MSGVVEKSPRVVLLLGAGASVAAGVPTTIQFVDEFLKAHTADTSLQGLVATLRERDPSTDVEALLRVLHSLSRRESVPESVFLQPIKGLASSEQLVKWRDSLESYIRQRCFVDPSAVTYLEPLRQLVANYEGPLDLFTVNYD